MVDGARTWPRNGDPRPYTRWWWLNGPFREEDIRSQLRWFAANGFGGVEIAWLSPLWLGDFERDRPEWLGAEWTRLVACTKRAADELDLGCDFTFGSVWPFGGACVPEAFASCTLDGPSPQRLHASWEGSATARVVNHLDAAALDHYVQNLVPAFAPALSGGASALFCDSLEVDLERLWSPQLWAEFEARLGYSLRDHIDDVDSDTGIHYDYRKVVREAIVREFYIPFARACHELGAVSRVQCHGAPADLLTAYAAVDVPESEALLFPPEFSRIPASAAALAGRRVVSCETFTCLYGFPRGEHLTAAVRAWKKERVEDLKLLADAVFANGVNQIVWHGAPYNAPGGEQEFYASVHVAPDSPLAPDLPAFNAYLASASGHLQRGCTHAGLAVYLPSEDMVLAGDLPPERRPPGAVRHAEMRSVRIPPGTEGYSPVWISAPFLSAMDVVDGALVSGELRIPALVIDVDWLDEDALTAILRAAENGLPTAVLRRPRRPGHATNGTFDANLETLLGLPNVVRTMDDLPIEPLVGGDELPPFWARTDGDRLTIFFAHPATADVRYPMRLGDGGMASATERAVRVHVDGAEHALTLRFERCASLLVSIRGGQCEYTPLPAWRTSPCD